MFTIKSFSNTVAKAGAFVIVTQFAVVDGDTLVGKKLHGSEEEAKAELDGLAGLAEGVEFAKAQFPEMSDKAQVGKANVIAEYLSWVAAGKPIKEVTAESEPAAPADGEAEQQASEEETF